MRLFGAVVAGMAAAFGSAQMGWAGRNLLKLGVIVDSQYKNDPKFGPEGPVMLHPLDLAKIPQPLRKYILLEAGYADHFRAHGYPATLTNDYLRSLGYSVVSTDDLWALSNIVATPKIHLNDWDRAAGKILFGLTYLRFNKQAIRRRSRSGPRTSPLMGCWCQTATI